MRAITEIPANTPRPMGSTDSCFPGIARDVAASAAADAGVGVSKGDEVAALALEPPLVTEGEGVGPGSAEDVGAGAPESGMPSVVTGMGPF